MDLARLRDEINKLYGEDATMGNNPPAMMVLEIIPALRKKVLPVTPGEEKDKKEEVK